MGRLSGSEMEFADHRCVIAPAGPRGCGQAPATADDAKENYRMDLRQLGREFMARPRGLHLATYRRLLRVHARIVAQLEHLSYRHTWPVVRKRLHTEFQNRLLRVRRRLGLRVPRPPAKKWYRIGEAAAFVGVSTKTLLRWTARGRVACERSPWGHRQRRYRHRDLVRLIRELHI